MSLKEFHLVFITASVFLSLGFSYWGLVQYKELHGGIYAGTSILSLMAAIGLVIYEGYFIKKTRAQGDR